MSPFLLLLLLLFLSPSLPTPTTAIVVDTDGNILQTSSSYYISPVMRGGFGGGLTLASKNTSELCPLYVILQGPDTFRGSPVKFWPWNSKQGFVSLSSNLNIDFQGLLTSCDHSTVWRLTADESTGHLYVGGGGSIWDPNVSSDWFKIEMVEVGPEYYVYKIVYCPGGSEVICGDIGVIYENGRRYLGITDKPLLVRFGKFVEV